MKRDDFKQRAYEILHELADRIDKLDRKADEIADDAKEAYYQQLDNLKGIRDNLAAKLQQYEKVGDSKWDVICDSASDFFTTVSNSWKENRARVMDAFKKTNEA